MKNIIKSTFAIALLILLVLMMACSNTTIDRSELDLKQGAWNINFKPENIEGLLVNLIRDARKSIDISMYGFDNDPIADALIKMYQNYNIPVRMSTEFDSESLGGYQKVIAAGIPVQLGNTSGIQHNKFLIIDKKYLVTGSTNLTAGMQVHFNNMIFFKHIGMIADYQRDFDIQWSGYYAGDKDNGHNNVFGSTTWDEKTHDVGNWKVRVFFTPYKKTFASYKSNDFSTKLCVDDPSNSKNPLNPSLSKEDPTGKQTALCAATDSSDTAQTDQCNIQDTSVCPTESFHACYDNSKPEFVYRFYDNDKKVFVCQGYDNALNKVLPLIQNAKKSIMFLIFAFRDKLIKDEVMRKKREGLDVKLWIDSNQYRSGFKLSGASFQAVANNTTFLKITRRFNGGLLHHKVLVIDDSTVVLGSLNFSQSAAEKNDENFIIIENAPDLAKAFRNEAARIDRESNLLPIDGNFTDVFEDATGAGATNL